MMLIQVIGGATVGYEEFTFPDGQRHVTLAADVSWSDVVVTASLCNADDLFDLLLVTDILHNNHNGVHLRVDYLLGARMDRRIDDRQPDTLAVVADIINAANFKSVSILDPHSDAALDIIAGCELPRYPMAEMRDVLSEYEPAETLIVIPDKGAAKRVLAMTQGFGFAHVQCYKVRDEQTGALSGFAIANEAARVYSVTGKRCLIVDDICDGGGTFTGLAKALREAGARSIDLFVTHGIFSKGRALQGIDKIYSTGSFRGRVHPKRPGVRTGP
ncbi:hypothetical protein LCGC14_2721590 [marine sediment metagenome]|uniref:Phosphoribosyl pyrophosphate synthase n=1 Tax=marine sediment metagenome TaxID=412755 RepID=A0A0F8ZXL5_9ZZZZ